MSGIMAVRLGVISLTLWGLLQHTTWACSVSCSTDYISTLNCTCADQAPAYPYTFVATCWEEEDHVNLSCEIAAPKQWCILELDSEQVISADTQCNVRAMSAEDEWTTEGDNITLQKHIKPQPPFNLTLTEDDSNFTVSWEMAYTPVMNYYLNNNLMYRVRMRAKDDSEKDPGKKITIHEDRRYLEVSHSTLEHGKTYVVDVQAKPNAYFSTSGYWSEWSPAVEVHVKYAADEGSRRNDEQSQQDYWFYVLVPAVAMCGIVLCYKSKVWLHKAYPCSYIPSPECYFKPLYRMHDGDFTKWVGPAFVFGEYDFLEKNMVLPVVNVKQSNFMPKCETESWESSGSACSKGDKSLDSSLLGMPSPQGQSFLDSNSGSQATQSSRGGISIDTVTVLEEEEEDEEEEEEKEQEAEEDEGSGPGGSWHSYRGVFAYPSFRLGEKPGGEGKALIGPDPKREAVISGGRMSDDDEGIPGGRPAPLGLYDLEWSLGDGASELERLSLDSFGSGERSEDGYPNVVLDLDTIDSGFLESDCGSPVRSDFGDKDEEAEAPHSHSNYVKQWVTGASIPDTQAESCGGGAHTHPHTLSVQS